MSYINAYTKRLYGTTVGDQAARAQLGTSNQSELETLTVSATANARSFKGPQRNGHFSMHIRNGTASGATSNLTLWYSNLPNPDPAVDTDWVQDTTFTTIDLTVANTSYFINVGNVNAEHVRLKPNVATSAGSMYAWVRVEGVEV